MCLEVFYKCVISVYKYIIIMSLLVFYMCVISVLYVVISIL